MKGSADYPVPFSLACTCETSLLINFRSAYPGIAHILSLCTEQHIECASLVTYSMYQQGIFSPAGPAFAMEAEGEKMN